MCTVAADPCTKLLETWTAHAAPGVPAASLWPDALRRLAALAPRADTLRDNAPITTAGVNWVLPALSRPWDAVHAQPWRAKPPLVGAEHVWTEAPTSCCAAAVHSACGSHGLATCIRDCASAHNAWCMAGAAGALVLARGFPAAALSAGSPAAALSAYVRSLGPHGAAPSLQPDVSLLLRCGDTPVVQGAAGEGRRGGGAGTSAGASRPVSAPAPTGGAWARCLPGALLTAGK